MVSLHRASNSLNRSWDYRNRDHPYRLTHRSILTGGAGPPANNTTVPSLHMSLQLISWAPQRARLLRRALYTHLPFSLGCIPARLLHTTSPIHLLPLTAMSPDQSGFSMPPRVGLSLLAAPDSSSFLLNLGSSAPVSVGSQYLKTLRPLARLSLLTLYTDLSLLALNTIQTLMMSLSRSLLLSLNSTQIQPILYLVFPLGYLRGSSNFSILCAKPNSWFLHHPPSCSLRLESFSMLLFLSHQPVSHSHWL